MTALDAVIACGLIATLSCVPGQGVLDHWRDELERGGKTRDKAELAEIGRMSPSAWSWPKERGVGDIFKVAEQRFSPLPDHLLTRCLSLPTFPHEGHPATCATIRSKMACFESGRRP